VTPCTQSASLPYVLHTQNEERNTNFYSQSACFVNTLTLNMYVCMSYYRGHQAKYGICIRVAAPQEYMNTYSTCRVSTGSGMERGGASSQMVYIQRAHEHTCTGK